MVEQQEAHPAPESLRGHAERIARQAGRFALDNVHRRREVDQRFPHDVKLRMDRDTQDVAESAILASFPGHAILGEEGARGDPEAEYRWVVDPIDGTMNYFAGIPHWCCSVAVQRRGRTVAGAVYHPPLDECFSAHQDGPACCNGAPIHPSVTARLEESFVVTAGLPAGAHAYEHRVAVFVELMRRAAKLRILGSAALDICYVACGRVEGMYEYSLRLWDVAAALLIAERAGARIERYDVAEDQTASYLLAGPKLWDALRSCVRPPDAPSPDPLDGRTDGRSGP